MKKKKIFLTLTACITPAVPFVAISATLKKEKNENLNEIKHFIVDTELARINRITEKLPIYKFNKVIEDINGRKFLLIVTQDTTSIVDLETLTTVELNKNTYDENIIDKKLIYGGSIGLFEKIGNNYKILNQEKFLTHNEIKNNYFGFNFPDEENFVQKQRKNRENELKKKSPIYLDQKDSELGLMKEKD
ncbi:hypothetical protein [Mycoplasmopsis columbina]|uniref:hypothetical protein n=1 Tax=Mycoplasmopsis columbina TaxID=114881 RepID=UPI0004A74694|nr:hypothetical protein [Mycoplasmopsis columbina]VEU76982.1 Uncharacterised protein [Mycoplasmopsis columbina]